jgi:hypothetical protein
MIRRAFALGVAVFLATTLLQLGVVPTDARNSIVYSDSLASGWQNWSWSTTADFASTAQAHSGSKSIAFTITSAWGGLYLGYYAGLDTTPYTNLRFYIHGGTAGGQQYDLSISTPSGSWGPRVRVTAPAAAWQVVDVPLASLGSQGATINGIALQDVSGRALPTAYLDDVEFYAAADATPAPTSTPLPTPLPGTGIPIKVDAASGVHAISPYIYGMSGGTRDYYKEMGISVVRWGGNQTTRSNWEMNSSNSGADWHFANVSQNSYDRTPGKASVNFVNGNRAVGAESFITIPTIGWVAKDDNNATRSTGVPSSGGEPVSPGSDAIAGYDPTANRNLTSLPSYPRKGAPFEYPPNLSDGAVYQDEWVAYLKSAVGDAASGGVRFYAMDNEPDLWADNTHVDIHPVRAGYDETLARFLAYASAVKAVDPSAQITGPVGWGWLSLWFSALDRGSDNFRTSADRKAHGDVPFYQWFLRQVKAHDDSAGQRTLDVLDIHYYPQGNGLYSGATDAATQALRLRSTRSLWDPTYRDESWQASTEGGPYLRFIPRLKELAAAEYPGTKVGITEWNWGADNHINGGLAIADVLGIFGREDLYIGAYWGTPARGSPGYWAWRMYRNYDGAYSRFGDVSVSAQVPAAEVDRVSSYASIDSATGELKLMMINKQPTNPAPVSVSLSNFIAAGGAGVFQYSQADTTKINRLADLSGVSGSIDYTLPPYSITLFVLPPSVAPGPTATPTMELTATPTPTPSPSPTATPVPPSPTPIPSATPTPTPDAGTGTIYSDSLESWQDRSWDARVSYTSTSPVYSGKYAISFRARKAWGAWSATPSGGGFHTTGFSYLRFYVNGGSSSGQKLAVGAVVNGSWGPTVDITPYIAGGSVKAKQWLLVVVPLSAIGAQNGMLSQIKIQDSSGKVQAGVYLDEMSFY